MPPQLAADTTTEAHEAQVEVLRRMGPAGRLRLGLQLADDGRELARAGIRARHPDYDESSVEDALRVLYLGPELFRAAWPGRTLVAP